MRRPAPRLVCGAIAGLGLALTAVWTCAAALMTTRGFGGANEGFYLTSYRWWDVDPRNFVGAQYLYGPIFHAVRDSVPGIRAIRLASVLTVHLYFGWAFVRWLRTRRPQAPDTRLWEAAGALMITASGGIAYGWLPGTPGYNDVALLGCLMLVGLLLQSLGTLERGRKLRWLIPCLMGATAFVMVLSKFSSLVAVLFIVVLAAWALHRHDPRVLRRFSLLIPVGGAVAAALFNAFLMPLDVAVPPIAASVAVVAGSSHPVGELAQFYAGTGLQAFAVALALAAPVLALVLVGSRWSHRRVWEGAALTVIIAEVGLLVSTGGLSAGVAHVFGYSVMIAALIFVGLASSLSSPLRRASTLSTAAPVYGILGLLPLLQATGTNNAIYAVAVNGTAAWVALLVARLTRPADLTHHSFSVAAPASLLAVALAAAVGFGGVTHDQVGRSLLSGPLESFNGIPELRGIAAPAPQARYLARLRARANRFVRTDGYPVIAYGQLAAYVFALGGRPIGNSWYSAGPDGLQSADLRASCAAGNPWGKRTPLVLSDRLLRPTELAGWHACGVNFTQDYLPVLRQAPRRLTVWLASPRRAAG